MGVYVSMLRGVNVGGHNKIKMDALRALYESLKLRNPVSYVQSGNVVFQSEERDARKLADRIEKGIERTFGFRPSVILRTTAELKDVIQKNPFAKRKEIEPSKLLVSFLANDPGDEIRKKVLSLKTEPEELKFVGQELYIYFPNGMARPKVPLATIERILKIPATGRNWNSVNNLLEIAEKLEAGE